MTDMTGLRWQRPLESHISLMWCSLNAQYLERRTTLVYLEIQDKLALASLNPIRVAASSRACRRTRQGSVDWYRLHRNIVTSNRHCLQLPWWSYLYERLGWLSLDRLALPFVVLTMWKLRVANSRTVIGPPFHAYFCWHPQTSPKHKILNDHKQSTTSSKQMPKSSKKTSKSNKSPSKLRPSTPLSNSSNLHTNPPPTTPRHVDFTLALDDEGHIVDGWSSDDSFEEKITWSRHRMRTTPGGFTPRNIQVTPISYNGWLVGR